LRREDIEPLRPAPPGSILPYDMPDVVGHTLRRTVAEGEQLQWADIA
jgi:sialic acid synthase SpsE